MSIARRAIRGRSIQTTIFATTALLSTGYMMLALLGLADEAVALVVDSPSIVGVVIFGIWIVSYAVNPKGAREDIHRYALALCTDRKVRDGALVDHRARF